MVMKGGLTLKRFLLAVLCVLLLITSVCAAEPNTAQVSANVNPNGTVQISLQLTLTPDGHVDSLVIPLGAGAKNAMVEGVSVRVRKVFGVPSVVLSRDGGYMGVQHINLTYTVTGCIKADNNWKLQVPLLAEGLAYALDEVAFRITMPGEFSEMPDFTSGYLGENVDNYMTIQVDGVTISGTVNTALRDRESLTFSIDTDPELFPRTNEAGNIYPVARILCLVAMGLMLLYWLLFLRWKIAFRGAEQPQAPEGVESGEIVGRLLGQSPDLPLMILSWAQAGYLTIHLNQDHVVTLHKRMDMGNERSDFEGAIFKELFGYGFLADTGDAQFKALRSKVEASLLRVRSQFRRKGGRILWVRALGAAAGLAAGIAMADMVMSPTAGRIIPIFLLGLACAAAAFFLQCGFGSLFCWNKRPGLIALGCAGGILLLGLVSNCLNFSMLFVALEALAGLLTVFGGQRTEIGRQTVLNILGFRRYLQNVNLKNITRIMDQRPGYYYDMAPFALALGVDRQFANRFGTIRLPDCMWLVEDVPQGNRAPEWYPVLRQVTQIMRGQFSRRSVRPKADVLYKEDFQQ